MEHILQGRRPLPFGLPFDRKEFDLCMMEWLGYPVKGNVYIEGCPECGSLMRYVEGRRPKLIIYWNFKGELRCLRSIENPKGGGRFVCDRCGYSTIMPCKRCGRGMVLLIPVPPEEDYMTLRWKDLEWDDFVCPFCPSWRNGISLRYQFRP